MENTSIQVKAILHRGPNEETLPRKEIRRFEIGETGNVESFEALRGKIVKLYPDLVDDSPFRLMWQDEEGDMVCFSTDEELAQALKFVRTQRYGLFKVIIKTPQQEQHQQQNQQRKAEQKQKEQDASTSNGAAQFSEALGNFVRDATDIGTDFCYTLANGRDPAARNKRAEKFAKKCEKMKQKQEFHQQRARQFNAMLQSWAPGMQQHMESMAEHFRAHQMNKNTDNDDSVEIPIHHSSSTNPTSTTTTTTTANSQTLYPDLKPGTGAPMETDGFTDVTNEALKLRMEEAIAKMAELGFEGDWVRTLLESVNCDITKAIEKMNPERSN